MLFGSIRVVAEVLTAVSVLDEVMLDFPVEVSTTARLRNMKTTRVQFVAMCSIMISSSAFARVGETEAQHEGRYGRGQKSSSALLDGATNRLYSQSGWIFSVAFVDGVAVRLRYIKTASAPGGHAIRDDEIAAILQAEDNGGTWKPQGASVLAPKETIARFITQTTAWTNSNGRTATMMQRSAITINSQEAEAFTARRKAEAEAKRKATMPVF